MKRTLIVFCVTALCGRAAVAQIVHPTPPSGPLPSAKGCEFDNNDLVVTGDNFNLVAVLQHPPKTKVTLSVDGPGGYHRELSWDPAVGDGLRHDVLLAEVSRTTPYRLYAYAEEDRIQTSQIVVLKTTQFTACEHSPAPIDQNNPDEVEEEKRRVARCKPFDKNDRTKALLASTQRTIAITPSTHASTNTGQTTFPPAADTKSDMFTPHIQLVCETSHTELSQMRLAQKEVFAASVARGFLDQTAPKVVTDTLAILAEIAVERAKAGAMELVREKFVDPICAKLTLDRLHIGRVDELAFPRTCGMLHNLRLEDLLSSGRNLVNAARDDVRLTLIPHLITKAKIPSAARDVARMALELGNKMLDGGGDEAAQLDLLVTQLDRTFLRGAVAALRPVRDEFLALMSGSLTAEEKGVFLQRLLETVLPADPGALLSDFVDNTKQEDLIVATLGMKGVKACERRKDNARVFLPADRKACVEALQATLLARTPDLLVLAKKLVPNEDELIAIESAILQQLNRESFDDWVQGLDATRVAELVNGLQVADAVKEVSDTLKKSCAVRLTIAIVKWCSARDACPASEIARAFDSPTSLFSPPAPDTTEQRERLCWVGGVFQKPKVASAYIDLATRAVTFLTQPSATDKSARVRLVLRWMLDLARTLDASSSSTVAKLDEILQLLEQRDYGRAIVQTFDLVVEKQCTEDKCEAPPEIKRALNLIGAVTSYLQVYDETKSSDPAEAKEARKRAIEGLIDSATDRTGRGGKWIFSLGVSAGATGGIRWNPSADRGPFVSRYDAYEGRLASQWRIPLGFALQRIPFDGRHTGYHFALTLADLGNFLRADDNADDIKWNDFLQLGLQAGVTVGTKKHAIVFAIDASWSPGTYGRKVVINDAGRDRFEQLDGSFALGLTAAYYLPIFDLN